MNLLDFPENEEPRTMFHPIGSKPTVCTFAHTPKLILTGHESGKVALFDAKTGEEVQSNERAHGDVVTDLQISPDRSYFITSSKDKMSRVRRTSIAGAGRPDCLPFFHFSCMIRERCVS